MSNREEGRKGPWVSAALWLLAAIIMFVAASYQERTGPTYPFKGSFSVDGEVFAFELLRSGNTDAGAPVLVPHPGEGVTGEVMYKRYPTPEPFSPIPMESMGGELQGVLPVQPAAGKLEYYVVLDTPEGTVRIPEGEETLILRYKDPVPLGFLVPHVICMFIGLLVGVRTALGALFHPEGVRRLAWTTLGLMTLGGMILGPIVQKYAFGAFWTGWPFGYDLTDNKTLIMWIVWVGVVLVLWKRPSPRDWMVRAAMFVAAAVMLAVYVIPHSLRGSQLDYSQLESAPGVEDGRF
jgi:hypothetical protein